MRPSGAKLIGCVGNLFGCFVVNGGYVNITAHNECDLFSFGRYSDVGSPVGFDLADNIFVILVCQDTYIYLLGLFARSKCINFAVITITECAGG